MICTTRFYLFFQFLIEFFFSLNSELALRARFNPLTTNPFFKLLSKVIPGELAIAISFDGTAFALSLTLPDLNIGPNFALWGPRLKVIAALKPLKIGVSASGGFRVKFQGNDLVFRMTLDAQVCMHTIIH